MRTVSQGNHLLVHATDKNELIRRIYESIVSSGLYATARVGYASDDAERSVRPIASAGDTGIIDDSSVHGGDDERFQGPTGTAIRTASVQGVKNLRRSKRCRRWREGIEKYGLRQACSFPLDVDGRIIDALTISPSIVRNHLSEIFRKLGIHSRVELLRVLRTEERTFARTT